jgi:Leucine-rich repeat (LRR) protein
LEKITTLEKIDYIVEEGITDSIIFKNLTNIKNLSIGNDSQHKFSTSNLYKLTNLESLYLDIDFDENYSLINNLKKLKTLYIYSSGINDLAPICNLSTLESLTLGCINLKGKNLSVLKGLYNLKYLSLRRSCVDNVNVLDPVIPSLSKLEKMNVAGVTLSDDSFIDNQMKSQILSFNNKIVFEKS